MQQRTTESFRLRSPPPSRYDACFRSQYNIAELEPGDIVYIYDGLLSENTHPPRWEILVM